MSKNTSGPWEAIPEKDESNFSHSIYSEGYDGLLVARCNQNNAHSDHARLIAAAPELLGALKAMTALVGLAMSKEVGASLQVARAAIAKAEGLS